MTRTLLLIALSISVPATLIALAPQPNREGSEWLTTLETRCSQLPSYEQATCRTLTDEYARATQDLTHHPATDTAAAQVVLSRWRDADACLKTILGQELLPTPPDFSAGLDRVVTATHADLAPFQEAQCQSVAGKHAVPRFPGYITKLADAAQQHAP